jgi:hypothetical protein
LALGVSFREFKIADDDSIWILTKTGTTQQDDHYLGKEVNVSTWKHLAASSCSKCKATLAIDEQFCPNCGAKKE